MKVMVYGDDERRIGLCNSIHPLSSASPPELAKCIAMFPAAPRAEADLGTYNDIFPPPGRLATVAAVERVLIQIKNNSTMFPGYH